MLDAKPFDGRSPTISFGGSSDAAYRVGAAEADIYAVWGEPLDRTAEQIARIRRGGRRRGTDRRRRASTPRSGRSSRRPRSWPGRRRTGSSAAIEARKAAAGGVLSRRHPIDKPENAGSQRLLEIAAQGERFDSVLWTATAKATGGAGNSNALVGTPEQVAEALLAYYDLGVSVISARGYDLLDDAIDFGRYVIPLVREGVAARDAARDRGLRRTTMRFQVLDIVFNPPHPVTGEAVPPADRLDRVVETAVLAEELGIDAFAVGERHAGEVLSSSPTVLLGALAASTSRILLSTGVTVLSLLDPIRVAEDYATIDQLSRGRLEIVIGKGNEALQYPLLGLDLDKQYEYLEENYELLSLLLSREDVEWAGRHRPDLHGATTLPAAVLGPVPHLARLRDLAVRRRPRGQARRPDRQRERPAAPRELPGAHRPVPRAVRRARPRPGVRVRRLRLRRAVPRGHHRAGHRAVPPVLRGGGRAAGPAQARPRARSGKVTSFRTIEEAVERGPALVGSPERVAEKILDYHASYGHDLQSVSINHVLEPAHQDDVLRRFAEEVVPLVKAEVKTDLWGPADARRPAGFTAVD